MATKSIGGAVLILGILLLLVALAQPTTVTDSSTSCVDSGTFGQECSTVTYERPNTMRTNLLGIASLFITGGLIAYGIGAAGSSGSTGAGQSQSRSSQSDSTSSADSDSERLSAQLAAHHANPDSAGNSPPDADVTDNSSRKSDGDVTQDKTPLDATQDTTDDIVGSERTRTSGGTSGYRTTLVMLASGLVSTYILSTFLSLVTSVENPLFGSFLFLLFALPGMLAYRRIESTRSESSSQEPEVTN